MSFGYLNRCKQRDGRRNKSVKYQLWKFVGNFPKPYICLATAQKGIWLLFFTVTQLSQATIYEKQLTPKQGRAKGEMQIKNPLQPRRETPSPPQSRCPPLHGCGQVKHGTPPSPPAPWGGLWCHEHLGIPPAAAGDGAPAPIFLGQKHCTALIGISIRSPQTTHLKALFLIIVLIDLSLIYGFFFSSC